MDAGLLFTKLESCSSKTYRAQLTIDSAVVIFNGNKT